MHYPQYLEREEKYRREENTGEVRIRKGGERLGGIEERIRGENTDEKICGRENNKEKKL